ncbi:alpha/beta hydrolase [Tomitella fengzijianii]|uniref:Alpha/beta hydrolase n=2 Tax=Tomitella fengzijianii TaxID=2597660 RepID=A0A516X041_9ACTN|nr:alpha/beta hydrolase [Tomitella fengzijianii]
MAAMASRRPDSQWRFAGSDGIHRLHVDQWDPPAEPRGVVQIVHGMADRIARYGELAAQLTAGGYAVIGADLLGHGETALGPGELGFFAAEGGWETAARDVRELRRIGARRFPGIPYFLLGHSMGSMLVRQHLDDHPAGADAVDGAILSGTTYMNKPMAAAGIAGLTVSMRVRGRRGSRAVSPLVEHLGGRLGKKFEPQRTSSDWLSRDPDYVDANLADPLCGFPATLSLSRDLMVGCRNVGGVASLHRLRTPVLFVSGSEDPLGGRPALRRIMHELEAAGHPDFTALVYPGGRHEMFGEVNRDEVFDDVAAWLDARTPARFTGR